MNCDSARPLLHDLLEGTLPSRDMAAVHAHLESCPGCRRQKALLEIVAQGIALLPARRPSAAFEARVLAASAAARRGRAAAWVPRASAGAIALWMAALATLARPRLGVSDALAVLHVLLHPSAALSAAQLRLAEAGLGVPETLRAARHCTALIARIPLVPDSALTTLPLQIAAAALISVMIVAAAVHPHTNPTVLRRTR